MKPLFRHQPLHVLYSNTNLQVHCPFVFKSQSAYAFAYITVTLVHVDFQIQMHAHNGIGQWTHAYQLPLILQYDPDQTKHCITV